RGRGLAQCDGTREKEKQEVTMMNLVFQSMSLGTISQPLFCDQTWFGEVLLDPSVEHEEVGRRILEYQRFSEDWNEELKNKPLSPPDDSQWNTFLDLLESSQWGIKEDNGSTHLVGCPVFFKGGYFSCRPWVYSHPDVRVEPVGARPVLLNVDEQRSETL